LGEGGVRGSNSLFRRPFKHARHRKTKEKHEKIDSLCARRKAPIIKRGSDGGWKGTERRRGFSGGDRGGHHRKIITVKSTKFGQAAHVESDTGGRGMNLR